MTSELVVPGMSTIEAFEKFLRLSVADGAASARTLRVYRDGFAAFLAWCDRADTDPRKATFEDIEGYRADLISMKLKRPTVKLRLVAVRALYTALQRWGIRPDNPAAGVKTPRDKEAGVHQILRKALSPDEVRLLLAALPGSWAPQDIRDASIIRLMIFQGLRAGEVSGLRSTALDYQSFSALDIRGKGDKPRTVVLNPETRKDMIAWTAAVKHPHKDAPLFFGFDTEGMRPLSVRAIERIVDRYLTKSGLKRAGRSAHALRHTYALLATMGGAQRESLADSLGHASLETTAVYTRAAAAFQDNPADAVQRALEKK